MRAISSIAVALLFGASAWAQFGNKPAPADKAAEPPKADDKAAAGGGANALFAALDLDGDGVISKAELKKASLSLKKLDTDKDGQLTLTECGGGDAAAGGAAAANNDQTQWIDRIMAKDKNHDNKLTPDELTENERQMLQGADQNNDGAVDRQELAAMGNKGNANGPGGNFANGGNGVGSGRGNEAMGRFFQYDRNGDGRLTADEVPPQAMGMLRGGDLNGDHAIDAAEMQAIIARLGDRAKVFGAGVDPNAKSDNSGGGTQSRSRNRVNGASN
jgi:hypothetical protein